MPGGLLCPCTNYRVSSAGFEPGADAVPSPDVAGRAGSIGADIMGDMMDMMGAAGKGDAKRAAADIADMARHQNSGEDAGGGPAFAMPRGAVLHCRVEAT